MKHDDAWSRLTAWRCVLNFFAVHLEEYFSSPILQDQRMCFRPGIAFARRGQWNDQLWLMTVAACTELSWNMLKWLVKKLLLCQKHGHAVQDSWYNSFAWCIPEKQVWQTTKGKQGQCQASWCKSQVYSSMAETLHQFVYSIFNVHTTQNPREFEDFSKPFLSIPKKN